MEINPDVIDTLKEFNIDKDEGLLCLLGIYHKLDVDKVCSEETIKAINLTGIVHKSYESKTILWRMSLYTGENIEWEWVREWNSKWNINMSRKASNPDVLRRMQDFFKKYPQYRKEDVIAATNLYLTSISKPDYLKNSAAFIFDGAGAMKKSILLGWCEKVAGGESAGMQRGTIAE